jgi:hypothetical protein
VQFLGQIQFAVPMEGVYWFDISYKTESLGGVGLSIAYPKPKEEEQNVSIGT